MTHKGWIAAFIVIAVEIVGAIVVLGAPSWV